MKKTFNRTNMASNIYLPKFEKSSYLERTKRNHYWLGGIDGQMSINQMRVGVAGLGGMGSNIAEILVRLGVGNLKIADPDTIEHSNINRQVIANRNTVGVKKAVASANELRNIAEDFELVVYEDGITKENVEEFVSDLDVIVDEIDVFPLRAHSLLHKEARKKNIPLYSGYIIGMGTHIYKFQGDDYTFDDFMLNNEMKIDKPDAQFLVDRYLNPPPNYLDNPLQKELFTEAVKTNSVPIFGASTYMSQSFLSNRLIIDFLNLDKMWNGPKTPVMPQFLKIDPIDLCLKICDINKLKK